MPKRSQISLDTLRKESIETHLWDLDGDSPSLRIQPPLTPRSIQQPAPPPEKSEPYSTLLPPSDIQEIQSPAIPQVPDDPEYIPLPTDDLSDLDDLDDLELTDPNPLVATIDSLSTATAEAASTPVTQPIPTSPQPSNRRRRLFSRPESVGIGIVGLLLLLCAAYFLFNAFRDLPRTVNPHEMPDFPIKGSYVTLTAADSYWRLPVTTGPDAEVVQRGTRLIPVVEIVAHSENATLRVQFRNSEGTPVGDPVTVPVRGNPIISIPSTSGFEDISMHNAYLIGMVKPWSVEILEAPASSTSGGAFRVLTSFPIATERR